MNNELKLELLNYFFSNKFLLCLKKMDSINAITKVGKRSQMKEEEMNYSFFFRIIT